MIDWVSSFMAIMLLVSHLSSSYPSCPDSCHCYEDTGMFAANCSALPSSSENIEILNLVRKHSQPLQLNDGQFTGFRKLKYLNLRNCSIDLVHKKAFFGIKSLIELDLSFNNIHHLDPTVFQQIINLTSVVLRGNHLNTFSDPFIMSESIEYLDLGQCGITEVPLELFHGLPQLKYLALDKNLLKTVIYNSLPKSLRYLNLSNNLIVNVPTDSIVKLRNLRGLDLSGNPVNCTCPLMNLQDHLSGLGVVFDHEVICSTPSEYAGLSWSKINENEMCIEASLFGEHWPIKTHKHKQKYKYQIHRKPEVTREINFDTNIQADQPFDAQFKHDPDSEVLFQNDETRSYGAMMNIENVETDIKDIESDKKSQTVVESSIKEIESANETSINEVDNKNENIVETVDNLKAEINKEDPTLIEETTEAVNTHSILNINNGDSNIDTITEKLEVNKEENVQKNSEGDDFHNEILADKSSNIIRTEVVTNTTTNIEDGAIENKHEKDHESTELDREKLEHSELVNDEEKVDDINIDANKESKHVLEDTLLGNKSNDKALGESDSLLEEPPNDKPENNVGETTTLETNVEKITNIEGIIQNNIESKTEMLGNIVVEGKSEEVSTENENLVEFINNNQTENKALIDTKMLGDLTQENQTEIVYEESTEKVPIEENKLLSLDGQNNDKDVITENSNTGDEVKVHTELPAVINVNEETTTEQDNPTTLLSKIDPSVELNNTDSLNPAVGDDEPELNATTIVTEITTVAPIIQNKINLDVNEEASTKSEDIVVTDAGAKGSEDAPVTNASVYESVDVTVMPVTVRSNLSDVISEPVTEVATDIVFPKIESTNASTVDENINKGEVNESVTEVATDIVLPEFAGGSESVNASTVVEDINQGEVIEDDGLIGDKTLKEILPFEFESAHVVLGCIIVLVIVLVLFGFYKCATEGKKSSRHLKDVESNHGTEMQDMASLLPKPKSDEPKIISKKYTDDAPNGENVSLIQDEKKENIETKPTPDNENINNNTPQNKPTNRTVGSLTIDPSSPIQRTRVKVGIIPDSIPRTPIFVQKSFNNGVTNG